MKSFWENSYRSSTRLVHREDRTEMLSQTENSFLYWISKKEAQPLDDLDELERYLAEPRLLELRSVISWWMDPAQRTRFSLLSAMAIDIFSIPAISSEPERVFSGTKHTITAERASLNPETTEALECMKSWFSAGLFTKEDLNQALANQISEA